MPWAERLRIIKFCMEDGARGGPAAKLEPEVKEETPEEIALREAAEAKKAAEEAVLKKKAEEEAAAKKKAARGGGRRQKGGCNQGSC